MMEENRPKKVSSKPDKIQKWILVGLIVGILSIYLFNMMIENTVIGYGDNALTPKQEAQVNHK